MDSIYINKDGEVLFDLRNGKSGNLSGNFEIIEGQPNRMLLVTDEETGYNRYIIDLAWEEIAGPYQFLTPVWWQGTQGRFMFSEDDQIEAQSADGEKKTLVRKGISRYGLVDQDGNEIFPAKFEEITFLGDGRYWVKDTDTYGLIDEAGNWYMKISEYEELMD